MALVPSERLQQSLLPCIIPINGFLWLILSSRLKLSHCQPQLSLSILNLDDQLRTLRRFLVEQ
jgi:hypothetical protein